MHLINIQYHKSKIGEMILGTFDNKLCLLDFRYRKLRPIVDKRIKAKLNAEFIARDNATLNLAREQLTEYLDGRRKIFTLPLLVVGSDFQKSVWRALTNVPYGTTSTYQDIANAIGNPKAVRAVANANGANALGLIIPCHRIIGSDGTLVGYGGGIPVKKRLLLLEGAILPNNE